MEIEEIQATWSQLSNELERQKKLTNKIILNMTQERYSNKFRTISLYESIGAIICFAVSIYILFNFNELDTWYLMACGIITLAFLLVMPVLVLKALKRIKNIKIQENSYKETLVNYERAKKNLLVLQQFGIYASFPLMIVVAAVFSKIGSGEDFFMIAHEMPVYVAIGVAVIFLYFFTRWGYKCYKGITNSAEEILKELE